MAGETHRKGEGLDGGRDRSARGSRGGGIWVGTGIGAGVWGRDRGGLTLSP